MAHKSGSNKGLKIVVEEVSKDGYRTIIFDRQPIKWIEILTEWGEILFEGKNSIHRGLGLNFLLVLAQTSFLSSQAI